MLKSHIVREFAKNAGLEVIELRLPESLPITEFGGFPRVDVKALIEQSRRRQAEEALSSPYSDD